MPFGSVLVGILPDYDDDVERRNTHPLLLPKIDARGVISRQHIKVLNHVIGSTDDHEYKKGVRSKLISPPINTVAKGRSV